MSAAERAVFQGLVDDIFDQFVDAVARGRRLSKEKVLSLADGRIYSGRQALGLGLVDQLGGFWDAVLMRLVDACLERDPALRWHSARDAATALGWADDSAEAGSAPAPRLLRRVAPWLAAGALVAVLMLALGRFLAPPPIAEETLRFEIEPPAGSKLVNSVVGSELAVSPDGRTIAFIAQGDGPPKLWLWSVTEGRARALEGSAGAAPPFWSPDGGSIGFFAGGNLRRIEIEGGQVTDLCEAPYGGTGSWVHCGTWMARRREDATRGGNRHEPIIVFGAMD